MIMIFHSFEFAFPYFFSLSRWLPSSTQKSTLALSLWRSVLNKIKRSFFVVAGYIYMLSVCIRSTSATNYTERKNLYILLFSICTLKWEIRENGFDADDLYTTPSPPVIRSIRNIHINTFSN